MNAKSNRPLGRPRLSNVDSGKDPKRAILDAAAKLFATQGFAGTSTREIAAAVGLRQPSLFHYFASKETILDGIIEELLRPSLVAFDRLSASPGEAEVDLYAAVWADALQVAKMPDAARALIRTPELRSERFKALRESRDRLLAFYAAVINRGQSDGVLVGGSPQVLSHLTASLVESVGDPTFEPTDPEHYADAVANYAVRGLLSRPTELAAIRRRALDLVAVTAQ